MCKKPVNVILTNISLFPFDTLEEKLSIYKDENGNEYHGYMTNEAPLRHIMISLKQKNEEVDTVLMIVSDKVRQKNFPYSNSDKPVTQAGRIIEVIKDCASSNAIPVPGVETVSIKDEPNEDEVAATVFEVYQKLRQKAEKAKIEDRKLHIFIEANGGVRYVLTMLLSITKSLETQYDNVRITKILSMVFSKPSLIRNTTQVYESSQIPEFVDEFLNYGRIHGMRDYMNNRLEKQGNNVSDEAKKDITALLDALNKLSDDIQLCRTTEFLNDFYKDGGINKKIEDFISRHRDDTNATVMIFRHLMGLIQFELVHSVYDGYDENNVILNLPKMIEWCLKKSFIQQALTLCTEKLPQYLFESKMLEFTDPKSMYEELAHGNKTYELNYYYFAHLMQFKNSHLKKLSTASRRYASIPELAVPIGKFESQLKRVYQINRNNITAAQIGNMLTASGFDRKVIDVNTTVKSKNNNGYYLTFLSAVNGRKCKIEKNTSVKTLDEPNLNNGDFKKERFNHLLLALIHWWFDGDKIKGDAEDLFNRVIDSLQFESAFSDKMKAVYSKSLSEKFGLYSTLTTKQIRTSLTYEQIQGIIDCFAICKEQRNLTNHAATTEDEEQIVLTAGQLTTLMQTLLKKLNEFK